jgi:peroxiredoxin (alkyl hydroperoxide reductase subunit C)
MMMSVLVGKKAPEFKAKSVSNGNLGDLSLADSAGRYTILFFYPLDFTFVCPTELHAFQEKLEEFKKLNCELIGCSVDSHFSHLAWVNTPKTQGGIQGVTYSLISDLGGKIAESYGVLSEDGVAYRGLFLIDKNGIVRHQVVNDLPLGRSVDEALRVLKALQYTEAHGEVCPANWNEGDRAIKATHESVSDYLATRA